MLDDTIAAVGTAPGEAGIGIVRLSGSKSQEILGKIFRGKKAKNTEEMRSRFMYYGFIYDEEDNKVDEVLAVIMRAPYSYTGEDVVEIHLSRRYNFHKKNYGAGIEKGSSYGRTRQSLQRFLKWKNRSGSI